MEDSVITWGILVVAVYGPIVRWCIKALIAERKANREKYWSRW